jgi:hypothetical protein
MADGGAGRGWSFAAVAIVSVHTIHIPGVGKSGQRECEGKSNDQGYGEGAVQHGELSGMQRLRPAKGKV